MYRNYATRTTEVISMKERLHKTTTVFDRKLTSTIGVEGDLDKSASIEIRYYEPSDFKFLTKSTTKLLDSPRTRKNIEIELLRTEDLLDKRMKLPADYFQLVKLDPSPGDFNDFDDPESLLESLYIEHKREKTHSDLSSNKNKPVVC